MSLKRTFFKIVLYPFLLLNRVLNGFRALFDKSETNNMLVNLAEEVKSLEAMLDQADVEYEALAKNLSEADVDYDRMTDALLIERDKHALLDGAFKRLIQEHRELTKQAAEATYRLHKVSKERSNLLNQVAELVERNNKEFDELFGAREDLAVEREKNIKLKKKLKKRSAK